MKTSWKKEDVANKFNAYNDMLEDILGFNYVFKFINNINNVKTIIDFGCGPGKVSKRLSEINENYKIVAVDESESMLKIASQIRNNKNIQYKLISNDTLDFVKSNSIDCVVLCFVIINNSSVDRINKIAKEIFRVLKPGGEWIILDSNPNAVGIEFSTFTNGKKGQAYKSGDRKRQYLKIPNDSDLILNDYYWSKEFYISLLKNSGFVEFKTLEPIIDNMPSDELAYFEKKYNFNNWGNEKIYAPFILFNAIKPTNL